MSPHSEVAGQEPPAVAIIPAGIQRLYDRLADRVRYFRPAEDTAPLAAAFEFAYRAHLGTVRETGEPYICHPLEVALILVDMQVDQTALMVGLLHDVVEENKKFPIELVREHFGPDVSRCVDGVTKINKLNFDSREDRQAENIRKMLLAMATDLRVIVVKLADRLHNLRTLDVCAEEKRQRNARETIEIYCPIAHRLGMGRIRAEMEDLSFRHLDPESFASVTRQMDVHRQANEDLLLQVREQVEARLRKDNVPARVQARLKRPYSVWTKMKKQDITIDQVYDLLALRIITDSVRNCYGALGVLHSEWIPIPGRIKDFIAMPRPNKYQSLHTSVLGPGGQSFEIQIRTEEMHRIAEEGIAAHWKYKEGKRGTAQDDEHLPWLRQLVEWQKDLRSSSSFIEAFKGEMYPDEVFVFTPLGRVVGLPKSATPVDFAFAIHSDVGNACAGAKVNGNIVPLKYHLQSGDIVEILTQPGHTPSRDWLSFVKTAKARSKIKHFIHTEERREAIELGAKHLEKEARRNNVPLSQVSKHRLEQVAGEYGFSKMEDLHAALGFGRYSPRQVLHKLAPESVPETPPAAQPEPSKKVSPGDGKDVVIRVGGLDGLLVYRAKCCNPIRGDAIVGYITRGKGVSVHARACGNMAASEDERMVDVEWTRPDGAGEAYAVKVVIRTDDRPGMLAQFTKILADEAANIRTLEARSDEKRADGAIVDMTIEVREKKHLERIIAAIRRVSGVRDIERVS